MNSSSPSSKRVFNVLVVEDTPRWQNLLRKLVQQACPGIEVHFAASYEAAIDALESETEWDLMTLDIGLPIDDDSPVDESQKLGKLVAQRASHGETPYVVVSQTEVTRSHDVNTLLREYGADMFFSKFHLDSDQFLACIRQLLDRGGQASSPDFASPAAVTIGYGVDCFVLKADGVAAGFTVPPDLQALFALYAQRVAHEGGGESLEWRFLNMAVDSMQAESETAKASDRLRTALSRLNKSLAEWAPTPDGQKWIVSRRRYGAHLNKSIRWSVDKDAKAALRKVYAVNVDPQTMAKNTPDREHRLPAQPTRKPRTDDEY